MEILQLHLKHFGKFTDYRLDLHAGINIISGGNETGKSTLHAFIRAMLYGVSRNRSRNLDEYQLREPWENPSFFAGSMKLLYGGKIYRIDRNFYRREERVEVVCETDGTKAEDPAAAISFFTGGLSETDFDNTVFIRQTGPEAGAQLGERLRDYLVNMEQTEYASLDVSTAQEYLKKKRKCVEHEKSAALEEIENRIREKTRESEYVSRDLERLLEKRSKEYAQEGAASFERVQDAGAEGSQDAAREDGAAAGGPGGSAQAVGSGGMREGNDPEGGAAAGDPRRGAPAGDPSGMREGSADAVREEDGEEGIVIPDDPEETGGVLLPVTVLLSFAAAILMCACAFLTADLKIRCVTGAGAALTGIVGICLLFRVLHPVSKAERIRKRMKREEFLNRHLGFREDPDDPADRAQALRREQKARDAILRAREEEDEKERQREEIRRLQVEEALKLQEKEDMERRGRDVERIARSQVLDREIDLRREKLDELRGELEALYRKKAALSEYDQEIRAIGIAQNRIRELSGSICHESGTEFAADVSSLLSVLTGGRYTRISLDEKNLVRLNTPDRLLTLEQISCSAMQQVYLALRLAAAGVLSKNAHVPLILDEPFAMYDEERLKNALRVLSGSARQVILFSCQTRELDMLAKMGLA